MVTTNHCKAGVVAGWINPNGYVMIGINSKTYRAHRLAYLYMKGFFPKNIDIDHIDRNKLNNSWHNLRLVSRQCNSRNAHISSKNTSGVTGVCYNNKYKKWLSHIKISGKLLNIGLYSNFYDAVKGRWDAEVKYNFPNCNTTSSAYLYLQQNNAPALVPDADRRKEAAQKEITADDFE
jgi:hypothetical protein